MLTEMTQRIIANEVERCSDHRVSLMERFGHPEHVQLAKSDALGCHFTFGNNGLYIQVHWIGDNGEDYIEENMVSYSEYNDWCNERVAA